MWSSDYCFHAVTAAISLLLMLFLVLKKSRHPTGDKLENDSVQNVNITFKWFGHLIWKEYNNNQNIWKFVVSWGNIILAATAAEVWYGTFFPSLMNALVLCQSNTVVKSCYSIWEEIKSEMWCKSTIFRFEHTTIVAFVSAGILKLCLKMLGERQTSLIKSPKITNILVVFSSIEGTICQTGKGKNQHCAILWNNIK